MEKLPSLKIINSRPDVTPLIQPLNEFNNNSEGIILGNRLDLWSDYTILKSKWLLSAKLGKDLDDRIISLLNDVDSLEHTPLNINYLKSLFVSRVDNDSVRGTIIFQKPLLTNGLKSTSTAYLQNTHFGNYIPGPLGSGGFINSSGHAEFQSLKLHSSLELPEIIYNNITYVNDEFIIGAGAVIKSVLRIGTSDNYNITLNIKLNEPIPFVQQDILKAIYYHNTGFGTSWFVVNNISDNVLNITKRANIEPDVENGIIGEIFYPPVPFMNVVRRGNFNSLPNVDRSDRQSSIVLSSKTLSITFTDGMNDYNGGYVSSYWGNRSGLSFIPDIENVIPNDKESTLYLKNLIVENIIKLDQTNHVEKTINDRGNWDSNIAISDPYKFTETEVDEVWYEAEKFRLSNLSANGTLDIPGTTSNWTLVLSLKDYINDLSLSSKTYYKWSPTNVPITDPSWHFPAVEGDVFFIQKVGGDPNDMTTGWSAPLRGVGVDGTSVKIVGSENLVGDLDDDYMGDLGDGVIVISTGDLHIWTGAVTKWVNVGKILGDNGKDARLHIAYADMPYDPLDPSKDIGFSQNPAGKAYRGIYADFLPTDAPASEAYKYNWEYIKGADGKDGVNGLNIIIVYAYRRSGATTVIKPSVPATYNFTTNTLIGLNNSWEPNIPDGTDQLYIIAATVKSSTNIGIITDNLWSSPVKFSADGINTATVYLYRRSKEEPLNPGSYYYRYTFSTGILKPEHNPNPLDFEGWSRTIPEGSDPVWITFATAISTDVYDIIEDDEWVSPSKLVLDGEAGPSGAGSQSVYKAFKHTTNIEPYKPEGDNLKGWTYSIPIGDYENKYIFQAVRTKPEGGEWTGWTISLHSTFIETPKIEGETLKQYALGSSKVSQPTGDVWIDNINNLGNFPGDDERPYTWSRDKVTYNNGDIIYINYQMITDIVLIQYMAGEWDVRNTYTRTVNSYPIVTYLEFGENNPVYYYKKKEGSLGYNKYIDSVTYNRDDVVYYSIDYDLDIMPKVYKSNNFNNTAPPTNTIWWTDITDDIVPLGNRDEWGKVDNYETLIANGIFAGIILLQDLDKVTTTAGLSGVQGDNEEKPAFWAGGTYAQANGGTAKAIIRHDGSSKFTDTEITGRVNAKSGVFTGALASPFDRAKPTSQYTNDFSNNIIVTGNEFFLPWTPELGSGRLIRLIQPNPEIAICTAPAEVYFFEDGAQKTTLKMIGAEIIELLGFTNSGGDFVGWLVLNRGLMNTVSTWGEPQRIVAQGRYKTDNPFKYHTFDGSEMTASISGQSALIIMPEHWFDSKDGYYVKVFSNNGEYSAIHTVSNVTGCIFGVQQFSINPDDNNKINLVSNAFDFFFEVHSAARLYGNTGSSGSMPEEYW